MTKVRPIRELAEEMLEALDICKFNSKETPSIPNFLVTA